MPGFNTSDFRPEPYVATISFSLLDSASPVNKKDLLPCVTFNTALHSFRSLPYSLTGAKNCEFKPLIDKVTPDFASLIVNPLLATAVKSLETFVSYGLL